jgi:putative cardiolipin synthase
MVLAILRWTLITIGLVAVLILVARLVFPPPTLANRSRTTALPPADSGALAEMLDRAGADHAGQTGIAPLQQGKDAFAARILLANAATTSIDAQYYIWRADMTGHLLLKALHRAAERGVRVRLLLDDNGLNGMDPVLSTLNAHPNIEVRLYNPFVMRRAKRLSILFDFFRLNHRMHNKSFTVDGRASILGGRNVGDAYFGTGSTPLKIDLDVLAVGRVVPEISADFDRYWNADPVFPLTHILGDPGPEVSLQNIVNGFENDPGFARYRGLLDASDIGVFLTEGELVLEWTKVVLISDDPVIGLDAVPRSALFISRLFKAVGTVEHRFDGVTPYFVPGATGVRAFAAIGKTGVKVRILTNSLEATDSLPVHAGYAKRRKALLRAGVELFEMRTQPGLPSTMDNLGPFGSSGSNLHAKTFAVDGTRVFVGSFNFDPRSVTLNTEMGLLIESTAMANALHDAFDAELRGLAWRIERKDGKLLWYDPARDTATTQEPGSTLPRRIALKVIGWLPVEWLL